MRDHLTFKTTLRGGLSREVLSFHPSWETTSHLRPPWDVVFIEQFCPFIWGGPSREVLSFHTTPPAQLCLPSLCSPCATAPLTLVPPHLPSGWNEEVNSSCQNLLSQFYTREKPSGNKSYRNWLLHHKEKRWEVNSKFYRRIKSIP